MRSMAENLLRGVSKRAAECVAIVVSRVAIEPLNTYTNTGLDLVFGFLRPNNTDLLSKVVYTKI